MIDKKEKTNPHCEKCGSELDLVDGFETQTLPTGMGFTPGDSRFQVDILVLKRYKGYCAKCRARVRSRVYERTTKTKYPAGINRKIRAAQQGVDRHILSERSA